MTQKKKEAIFVYLGREEHGKDAVFTPFPDGHIDPFTWEKGTWQGAGKWWIDKYSCNVCGATLEGHPDSGEGATIGLKRISKLLEEHVCSRTLDKINITKEEIDALKIVLDYVERWNKGDKEIDVAEAARVLEDCISPSARETNGGAL